MSILVVCSECKSQYRVSDKYAGKQGACPKCKAPIKVPNPDDVKIHVPEEFGGGGKDVKGRLITKPIAREETKFNPILLAAMFGGAALVLVATWLMADLIRGSLIVAGAGLAVVSVPLAAGCYATLRAEELEPYRGRALWIRSSIVAAFYVVLWGVFAFLPAALFAESWNWLFIAPPFLVAGATAAFACLDLDFTSGFLHYTFYLLASMALRAVAGLPALWNLAETANGAG